VGIFYVLEIEHLFLSNLAHMFYMDILDLENVFKFRK